MSKLMCSMKSALGIRSDVRLCCWRWVLYHHL